MDYMNGMTNNVQETEVCDRTHCSEVAVGEDRRGVPVCQEHAEEDWAKD